MEVVIAKDYKDMSRRAAILIAGQVMGRQQSVLGFATGSTPVGTYSELVAMYREGIVDFSGVSSFNLDEYYGIGPDNPCSYRRYMAENLFDHINILALNTHVPNGLAADIEAECRGYEEKIRLAGGIDLQLLGIGNNGHIGFNEPADFFPAWTHLVDLAEDTISANARFFASPAEVPRSAISMGIRSIMAARRIVLLANGAGKAKAIKNMVEGPITPSNPASILQIHPKVTIIVDREAGAHLA